MAGWAAAVQAVANFGSSYVQYNAAEDASRRQFDSAKAAMAQQQQQYQQTRDDLAPYRNVGPLALSQLSYLTGVGPSPQQLQQQQIEAQLRPQFTHSEQFTAGPSFTPGSTEGGGSFDPGGTSTRTTFDQAGYDAALKDKLGQLPAGGVQDPMYGMLTRPFSLADFQASPAYQFNLSEGQKALNKQAAARGAYYNPSTLQDLATYSQGVASNEFQNAFGNYQTNLGNIWSRLYGLSATGQNAAVQTGGFGASAAGNIGNALMAGGDAQAQGAIGQANALSGGIQGVSNAYQTYLMQQQLQRNQQPTYDQQPGYYYAGGGGGSGGQADFSAGYY